MQLSQLQLGARQAVTALRPLQRIALVVAHGSGELLVVWVARPHLRRRLFRKRLADFVPLAQVLDRVRANLDGDLGEDGHGPGAGDAYRHHDGRHALLQALRVWGFGGRLDLEGSVCGLSHAEGAG